MSGRILVREYKGYTLKTEESGNVSIYKNKSFKDKFANMSEAIDRLERFYIKPKTRAKQP